MRHILALAFALILPAQAMADAPALIGPNNGKFGDWTAASYGSGAAKICYAFTKVQISKPNWKSRGKVMLTVTERKSSRDEVSIAAGYTYAKNAAGKLTIGTKSIDFYTQDSTAFTTSGADAVTAFKTANSTSFKSPGPKGKPVEDQFSLSGFSGAYKAITSACP